jgi:hypothetical protein
MLVKRVATIARLLLLPVPAAIVATVNCGGNITLITP